MDVRVEPGRLVEEPVEDSGGVDRRAFGEFVGPQGEMASYAIGWTTGADPHVARMTVGIGAGHPEGGTFHAVVFDQTDSYAYSLVDEPFEEVPQGGRHLTAEQARAHEDLPFVWWVVDQVMQRDPRAWWMRHWLVGTKCIATVEVFEKTEPVLLVCHDEDEWWQLIGASDAGPEGRIGHLSHAIDDDPTLIDVLDLGSGWKSTRSGPGEPWTRHDPTA